MAGEQTQHNLTWPRRLMTALFAFLAFECFFVAALLQGRWFILIAPAIVCAVKAFDLGRELRRAAESQE